MCFCVYTRSVWCGKSSVTVVWDENRTSGPGQCDTMLCGARFSQPPVPVRNQLLFFFLFYYKYFCRLGPIAGEHGQRFVWEF